MSPLLVGITCVCALLLFVTLGVRVVYAAAAAGLFGLIALIGWGPGGGLAGTVPHSKSVTYALSVLPLFILVGYLAFHAGLTTALFDAARKWVGRLPGGLAIATVLSCAGFAAVSGASVATTAVFSRAAIPEMLSNGYDRRLAAGVTAAGGTLASLIPPSAILVIYAIIVEESVGALLLAGFLPGIVSVLIYVGLIMLMVMRNPKLAPPAPSSTMKEKFASLPPTLPIFLVAVIIFSAIYWGWATPTEAGALGAFIVFLLALRNRAKWPAFHDAFMETAKLTAMIFALIWGVLVFVRLLGFSGLPEAFQQAVLSLDAPPIVIMILILMCYAVLGMFMDAIGMLILTLPLVYPVVVGLGYDPIWFGVIVVKMVEICLITPPIGLNCFVVSGVRPDIPLTDIFKGILPFFIADVVTVAVLVAFPELVLWLPNTMGAG